MLDPTPALARMPRVSAARSLVGLDWGTSALRACRIDASSGAVLESRACAAGILAVADGDFEAVLRREAGDWLDARPAPAVIASGMIGSRQGWVEVPYARCPAGVEALAAGLVTHRQGDLELHFVPGLALTDAGGVPDVMRGEETQILGATSGVGPELFVLPGTHSKWALASGGTITWFATFMTGELFAALCDHTILGRMMEGDEHDEPAFLRGAAFGRGAAGERGGLLRRLFSARTLALFDALAPRAVHAYLSGLLIGAEIAEALDVAGDALGDGAIVVVGDSALGDRYLLALADAGLAARRGPADASARGQFALARAGGLVG